MKYLPKTLYPALLGAALLACSPSETPEKQASSASEAPPAAPVAPPSAPAAPVVPLRQAKEAHYSLHTSASKATRTGKRWTWTTDRNFTVTLEQAYLASYTVQLVRCKPGEGAPATPSTPAIPATGQQGFNLFSLFSPSVAFAGHSNTLEPSAAPRPWVDSLLDPTPRTLAPVLFPAEALCNAHYLVARANEESLDRPSDPDMMRVSLLVKGTWQASGEKESHPFTWKTSAAHATVKDISAVSRLDPSQTPSAPTSAPGTLLVSVTRDLDTLFSGIDMATADEKTGTRALLKNLLANTRIEAKWEGMP